MIHLNKYYEEIRRIPILKKEEEKELGLLILKGDKEAKQKLIYHNLRLPVHMVEKINKIKKAQHQFSQQHGREATLEELSLELPLSISHIKKAVASMQTIVSLDETVSDDGKTTTAPFQKDQNPTPEESVVSAIHQKEILALLDNLDAHSQRILYLRFGLEETEVHTLEAIAKMMGITKERVRQIEKYLSLC